MNVTVGRTVIYTLNEADAAAINRRRDDAHRSRAGSSLLGFIVHEGNQVFPGEEYPMVVTRVWHPTSSTVNGQLFLDGNDLTWLTSRAEGDGPGTWHWPTRVAE